jgi:GST-like protein
MNLDGQHGSRQVIDLYFGPTPNGRKIAIALEEMALTYETHIIDILAGDQFRSEFLEINPNNKMPAIVDRDGPDGKPIAVWESGAILIYLAEKVGKFIPEPARARTECIKWLMFQMAGVGPMAGQFAFFNFYCPEKIPLAIERYRKELSRQMRVMDEHLSSHAYFAGGEYSIADMAIFPWWDMLRPHFVEERPALDRWASEVAGRPSVVRAMQAHTEAMRPEVVQSGMTARMTDDTYSLLYGEKQYVGHAK